MMRRMIRVSLTLILALSLALPFPLTFACGPDFTGPVFTSATGPAVGYSEYARGRLELLQHTYWHEPLYIAYRNLAGKPFTAAELKTITAPSPEETASTQNDWVEVWRDTRAKLVGKAPDDQQLYSSQYGIARQLDRSEIYIEYYNCLDNAFQSAVQTLSKRVGQFGTASPVVKDWIAAQDQVFENCSGGAGYPPKPKPAVIPAAAHPGDPEVVRADRAYQIAAAHFYAGDYASAQSAFAAVAKDSSSPYNKLGSYLVARVLVRQGTLDTGDNQYDPQALSKAEARLHAILADKNLTEMHAPAQRLLGFVSIRLHRQERFHELENSLSSASTSDAFPQDLTDYFWLLDHPVLSKTVTLPSELAGQPPRKGTAPDESTRLQGGEMTDWILTFQQTSEDAYQHSLQRWQETKSLPWLVAVIAKVAPNDKAAAVFSAAAAEIAPNSPAYVTLAFHRFRLLEQSGEPAATRLQLDQFLSQRGPALSFSAKNEFIALRLKVATNLQEFLQFAPRTSDDAERYPAPPEGGAQPASATAVHFDSDASVVFTEKLPLRLLADAAKSDALPKTLRREVVIAAWTRAVLLNDAAVTSELLPTLRELVPELSGTLTEYAGITDAPSRQFAATFMILRNPGFRPFVTAGYPRGNLYTVGEPRFDRIDDLRDNWWCAVAPDPKNQFVGPNYYRMYITLSSSLREVYPDGTIPSPAFLTAEDRGEAAKESTALEALPAAPSWLGKRTLHWANTHPDDSRVPEALHLVVRARRYGCADFSPENYSKAAFTLLHTRYPDSEWTKKTPFWFQ